MPLIPDRRETIAGASAALARGELTCEGLLETCLGRIDAWESQIHAWVSVDREAARRQGGGMRRPTGPPSLGGIGRFALAALWHSDRHQGHHRHRRASDGRRIG